MGNLTQSMCPRTKRAVVDQPHHQDVGAFAATTHQGAQDLVARGLGVVASVWGKPALPTSVVLRPDMTIGKAKQLSQHVGFRSGQASDHASRHSEERAKCSLRAPLDHIRRLSGQKAVERVQADEHAVQHWLAEQLKLRSAGRFTVTREKEVALDDRPDITVTSATAPVEVAVELKHGDKDWSLRDLHHALVQQLAEDYLKPAARRHGVLVITNHRSSRFWRDTAPRRSLRFAEVIADLTAQAETLTSNAWGLIGVEVRGLDASNPKPAAGPRVGSSR